MLTKVKKGQAVAELNIYQNKKIIMYLRNMRHHIRSLAPDALLLMYQLI